MSNPFILAVLPAILTGFLNGYYWSKQGYNRVQYTVFGMFIAYALFMKLFKFLLT